MTVCTKVTDLGQATATELLALYASGKASPVEATQAALDRIDRFNPAVNAYCHVDHQGALASARQSEQRWQQGQPVGPLDGVPSSIKDLTLTIGMPTRKGSRTTSASGPWDVDAPYSARMRAAGAVLLGKTTSPEFGWKGVTDNPLYGITRNPWNTRCTAGGSSGGAGAAAALNMGVLHQGSDAGGSIRIPCGFTGTFGLKSTFGLVPQWPASAMTTLSHLGPMTRTVRDSALMMTVTSAPDQRDWYAAAITERDWQQDLERGVKGLKIAYSPTLGYVSVDPEIAALVRQAVNRLADMGAIIEEVDPGFSDPLEMFNTLWFAGAAKVVALLSPDQRAMVDPGFLAIAEQGSRIGIVEYMKAQDARAALGQQMAEFHARYDALITPTLPLVAFEAGHNVPPGSGLEHWMNWTPFSYPFNLTQQPAASVPCGLTSAGLPAGVHVVADKYNDALVMQICQAIESSQPPSFPSEPLSPAA
ncbi:amidase [Insolitispirillum peregrinum]|uniref:Aspartyl-tRNA(Asn)/glutamyl-tRNA(Gln) amidotransferase subunit A n=1 Tax=Insolitispirillum peregrinum TaxID=80876 RepID=A0A1N7II79_9PROT|nr:amidase [Insolitispirillum peregrinum]SIS36803.1 aspartyl-tRNA(Asn)/glutamyl-tRNA(Gln) amidotransferase subunit A [Insolitispirillum peregrinum]